MKEGKQFYDEGWNAFIAGKDFDPDASDDWKQGWKDAYEAPEQDRQYI